MQVDTFDPSQLHMTNRARGHVRQQLSLSNSRAVLLGVSETGCNGYMYDMSYVDDQTNLADTKEFDFGDGVKVLVATENWEVLRGTQIDYVTEGLNSTLKFNNPNADSLCGCGESFSLRGT